MKYTHDLSFEQRLAKIDLAKVMEHVAEDTGMPAEMLVRAEDLYRKYLTLVAKYGKGLVPPKLVDLVWHAHITFTRQYMADCDMLFGEYLHHDPAQDEAVTSSLYDEVTVARYHSDFGVNLYAVEAPAEMMMAARCG